MTNCRKEEESKVLKMFYNAGDFDVFLHFILPCLFFQLAVFGIIGNLTTIVLLPRFLTASGFFFVARKLKFARFGKTQMICDKSVDKKNLLTAQEPFAEDHRRSFIQFDSGRFCLFNDFTVACDRAP